MKKAGDYLSKFERLTPPNDALRRAIQRAVHVVSGVRVEKGQVKIQNGTAFIEVSSVAKHKLRTLRAEILRELYDALPRAKESVRDIR